MGKDGNSSFSGPKPSADPEAKSLLVWPGLALGAVWGREGMEEEALLWPQFTHL